MPTDKKFTGQRLDGTGLYYYGARYYDPQIGRFISADTVVPELMNPQALNRYSYVINNPLRYADPTGHKWFDSAEGGWPRGSSFELFTWKAKQALDIAISKIVEKANEVKQTGMDTLGIKNVEIDNVPLLPGANGSPTIPVPVIDATPGGLIEEALLDPLRAAGVTLLPVGIVLRGDLSPADRPDILSHEEKHVPQELTLGPAFYLIYGMEWLTLTAYYYGDEARDYQFFEQIARIQTEGQQDFDIPWKVFLPLPLALLIPD